MKKQFIGNAVRKTIFFFGVTSFLLFSFMPSVLAQGKPFSTPQVFIKYIGSVENQPVFQIEFDNRNEETYSLSIKDEDGNLLYSEKTNEKKFLKKFQYLTSDLDQVKLTFTVTSAKDKQAQSYEVNTKVRYVQDVVVTRL